MTSPPPRVRERETLPVAPPPQTTSDGQKRGALKLDRRHHSVDGRLACLPCSTTHPWTSFWTTPLLLGPLQLGLLSDRFPFWSFFRSHPTRQKTILGLDIPRHSHTPFSPSRPIPPFPLHHPRRLCNPLHSSSIYLYLPTWLPQQEPEASTSTPSTTTLTSPSLLPSRSTATLAT